jgi:hypothetical protein
MADLGTNSVWNNVSNGAATAQTEIVGPAYSYADNIQTPGQLGVGTNGTFDQLYSNLAAVGTYVDDMTYGSRPLGNRFYINTGGTCTAPDGSLQSRYNFINNVGSGLIPGVVGDIQGLNPTYLFTAIASDSSPACKCYRCPVTSGGQFNWLSPNLSPDFDPRLCQEVASSNCPQSAQNTAEFFTNDIYVPLVIAGIAACSIFLLRSAK